MPSESQISVTDTGYDLGTPAVFANPLPNGRAIYRFINVSVPEPSSALLTTLGFLGMLLPRNSWRRNGRATLIGSGDQVSTWARGEVADDGGFEIDCGTHGFKPSSVASLAA
jgi:hypothetical protein